MSLIHQLSPHVANLIAAGEVVERPGSVVKELLENAVDAGARHVTVEIQNGGMTFIRVTDDGCGMAPDDAETAFLRHATSKIRDEKDLETIGTLGFRGEALAAIASVSRIDLLTRTADAEAGVSLRLEGGSVTERVEAGCPVGTTIIVRDLFFNTPARMKFMKSDSAEGSNVFTAVQNQALSHPDVAYRFLKDGQELLSTPGDGDLRSAVYCVYGREFSKGLVPVESRWEKYALRGFVTAPTATRGNRSGQHFFVDGRPVKSRLLTAALEQAYQNRMMTGRFPACVLHLDIPSHLVDVNVHPAKTEVKFLSERDVFDAVHYGVLGALNKTVERPEMHLKTPSASAPAAAQKTQTPVSTPVKTASHVHQASSTAAPARKPDFFRTMDPQQFRSFAEALEKAPKVQPAKETVEKVFSALPEYPEDRPAPKAAPKKAEQPVFQLPPDGPDAMVASPMAAVTTAQTVPPVIPVPQGVPRQEKDALVSASRQTEAAPAPQPEPVQENLPMPEAADYRVVGEVLDTYIIVEQQGKVLFLDKHAAHERILFERLRASETEIMAQMLLTPISVQLEREEAAAVLENRETLRKFGFEADDFGDGAVVLRQIPADLDESQAEATLQELAEGLVEGRHDDPMALRDHLLHTIACKAAIKAGWHTEPAEREDLVRQVLSRDDILYCPHGRPVCITLTKSQLERQFKRS